MAFLCKLAFAVIIGPVLVFMLLAASLDAVAYKLDDLLEVLCEKGWPE
jgi:hypothetical protein